MSMEHRSQRVPSVSGDSPGRPRSRRSPAGISLLLAALVLLSSGCQQVNRWVPAKWASRAPVRRSHPAPRTAPQKSLADGQKAEVQIAMARNAEQNGDTDQAMQAYEEALQTDDSSAVAYHRLALLHDKRGDGAQAESLYREALARAPADAQIHCDFGYHQYVRQRWREAEASLRTALKLQPNFRRAHNNLGLLLVRTDRLPEALVAFNRAGLSESEAHVNVAFAQTLDGRLEEADQQLQLAGVADAGSATQPRTARLRQLIAAARKTAAPNEPSPPLADPGGTPPGTWTAPGVQAASYERGAAGDGDASAGDHSVPGLAAPVVSPPDPTAVDSPEADAAPAFVNPYLCTAKKGFATTLTDQPRAGTGRQ